MCTSMHESALGCMKCTWIMRVHLEHESAIGMRMHLGYRSTPCAFGMRVYFGHGSAPKCVDHESALSLLCMHPT